MNSVMRRGVTCQTQMLKFFEGTFLTGASQKVGTQRASVSTHCPNIPHTPQPVQGNPQKGQKRKLGHQWQQSLIPAQTTPG